MLHNGIGGLSLYVGKDARQYSKQEPGALAVLAGICSGGAG
jgi:hypothetical protein